MCRRTMTEAQMKCNFTDKLPQLYGGKVPNNSWRTAYREKRCGMPLGLCCVVLVVDLVWCSLLRQGQKLHQLPPEGDI